MDFLFPAPEDIAEVMRCIRKARIGVLGDFCIDAYFEIDPQLHETSLETGKRIQHVRRQRYSPGGGGNVVVNLRALEVAHIEVFGVIGDDLYGRELRRMFTALGTATQSLFTQDTGFDTPVYGKPLIESVEQQRLDFGAFNHVNDDIWSQIAAGLRDASAHLDFLIVNQQLVHGWCNTERAVSLKQVLLQHWSGRHLVDTRDFVHELSGTSLKVNLHEVSRLLNPHDSVNEQTVFTDENILQMARSLCGISLEVQFMTCSERGLIACELNRVMVVPGVAITGLVDPVGAGDTATAVLAACRAAKLPALQSAVYANLTASITVRKINQTGTATENELQHAASALSYVYHPTLADEPRHATYISGTDIECIYPISDNVELTGRAIRYALFDHDGTVSTLRQGWESVMEPMMIRAILGEQYNTVNTALFDTVQQKVRHYIEQSTGIQTIAQMDALVGMVGSFDVVPIEDRLDAWGYKRTYNDDLMRMVDDRIQRLDRGELMPDDFIMKGAVEFIRHLRDKGIVVYLVSGTDESDTRREAQRLGYADLFDGGIFGAQPGSRADMKQEIIRDVIAKIRGNSSTANDTASVFIVIGDGPVEIRLGRRHGGLTLGVASNEERRFGVNLQKRRRLIRAGAHCVVPDFTQWQQIAYHLLAANT